MRWPTHMLMAAAMGLIICCQTPASAQEQAVRYNQANELYRKGQFQEALAVYESLATEGFRNGDLCYNLGNAHFKAGHLGHAIVWYERARRLLPGDADVSVNLRFAHAQKVDIEEEEGFLPVIGWLVGGYRALDPQSLLTYCTILLFGAAAAAILWLFRPERRTLWAVLTAMLMTGWMGTGLMAVMRMSDLAVSEVVILADEVLGRSGPGVDYLEVFALHEGTKVTVEREEGEWLLVRLASGMGGWIQRTGVERI